MVVALAGCENSLLAKAKNVQDKAESPGLAVIGPDNVVGSNGATLDYQILAYLPSQTITVTITNIGNSPLLLAPDKVVLTPKDGTEPTAFSVASLPTDPIPVNGKASLVLNFAPSTQGKKQVTLTLGSNDINCPNFSCTVSAAWYSDSKSITSFRINGIIGVIDGSSIVVNLPNSMASQVDSLIARFVTTGVGVKVNGVAQVSNSTANDFSGERVIVYQVAAADGSTRDYSVQVKVAAYDLPTLLAVTRDAGSVTATSASGSSGVSSKGGSQGRISERGLCWATTSNPTLDDSFHKDEAFVPTADGANDETTFSGVTMTGLQPGTTYYVRAYATNQLGTGYGPALSFPTIPLAPSAWAGVSATTSSVTLNWSAVPGATQYYVYRGGSPIATVNSPTLSHTDSTGLSANTQYTYAVRSVNVSGVSPDQLSQGFWTLASAPSGLSATAQAVAAAGQQSVKLDWTASGGGVTGYKLYRNGILIKEISGGSTVTCMDTGLTGATSYSYTLSAVNPSGESALSGTVSAVTQPDPPTGLGIVNLAAGSSTQSVKLTWNASAGGVNGYKVYRDGSYLATVTGAATATYTDSGRSGNTTYSYSVSATTASGESLKCTAVGVLTVPNQVSGLSASNQSAAAAGQQSVRLTWTAASGSGTISSYKVFRDGTHVATVTSGTAYTDTGRTGNTLYSYAIAAVNAGGESVASASASRTTYPDPARSPGASVAASATHKVDLSWNAPVSGATSYNVYRSTTSGSGYSSLATGVSGTTWSDTTGSDGSTYYYVVKAVTSTGESVYSPECTATLVSGISLPARISLDYGDYIDMAPVFTPAGASNKTVTWTSSNPAVRILNDRMDTSSQTLLAGTTITATTADGQKTASSTVFVAPWVNLWRKCLFTGGSVAGAAYNSTGDRYVVVSDHRGTANNAIAKDPAVLYASAALTVAGPGYSAGVFSPSNDFSVSLWFKVTNSVIWWNNPVVIGLFPSSTDASNHEFRWAIYVYNGVASAYAGVNNGASTLTPGAAISANTWYHVVLTYTASTKALRYYQNGSLIGSPTTYTPTNATTNNGPLYLGNPGGESSPPQMHFDDLRIYSRVLSDTEVSGLYGE